MKKCSLSNRMIGISLPFLLVACSSASGWYHFPLLDDGHVRYSNSSCMLDCAVFDVFAFADGTILFRGYRQNFSDTPGERKIVSRIAKISPSSFDQLMKFLEQNDFATLYDNYSPPICGSYFTDAGAVTLEVRRRGQVKQVVYNFGCQEFNDEARLQRITNEIGRVLGVSKMEDELIPSKTMTSN